MCSVTN